MPHECSRFRFGKHWPHLILLCFTSGSYRGSGVAVLRSRAEAGLELSFLFAAPKLPQDFGAVMGWLVCRGTLWPHIGVVEPGFRDGGYPLHLPFLWDHMFSRSTSYFFLQSGLLCLIIQKHITSNDCCPYLSNLSALLPISIWPVSSYCSSDFKGREYKCSLASRWWAALSQEPAWVKSVAAPWVTRPTSLSDKPKVQRSISEKGEWRALRNDNVSSQRL